MLTKTDLKQIGNLIDTKLDNRLQPINNNIANINKNLTNVNKDLKYLKKKVNRIDKTVSIVVKNYDEADVQLHRRVRRIEQHLALD